MHYDHTAIADTEIPRAVSPLLQHLVDTDASETNKLVPVWKAFDGRPRLQATRAPGTKIVVDGYRARTGHMGERQEPDIR